MHAGTLFKDTQLQASALTSKQTFSLHFVEHMPCRKYHQSRFKYSGMSTQQVPVDTA